MATNPNEPRNESFGERIVKYLLPVEEVPVPPQDEALYWAACEFAFKHGLALGVLKPDLAWRLLAEVISETAEQEHPLFGLVQMGEGGDPPSLSDMDALTHSDLEQAVQDLAEFVQRELSP
jgi:hypothetical protein